MHHSTHHIITALWHHSRACMQAFEERLQSMLEERELPGCSDDELARLRHLIDD